VNGATNDVKIEVIVDVSVTKFVIIVPTTLAVAVSVTLEKVR
jgi:hypothetical protein